MSYSQQDQAARAQAERDALNKQVQDNPAVKKLDDLFGGHMAQNVDNTTFHNPGSANYGGSPEAAGFYHDKAVQNGQANDAEQASNAGAMQRSLGNMTGDRGPQATENWQMSGAAGKTRNEQLGALELQRQAASGGAPSAAAVQTRMGMDQAMGQALQATGRGVSGLSGAQAASGAALGSTAGGLAATGGMARSKEITDAMGLYGSQAGGVRGQDLNRLGMSNQNNAFNAQQNAQWKVGNANLLAQQGNLATNQRGSDLAWQGAAMDPAMAQFQMDQEMAATEAGADADKAAASIARNRESDANTRGLVGGAFGAGLGMLGSMAGPAGGMAGSYAGQAMGNQIGRYF